LRKRYCLRQLRAARVLAKTARLLIWPRNAPRNGWWPGGACHVGVQESLYNVRDQSGNPGSKRCLIRDASPTLRTGRSNVHLRHGAQVRRWNDPGKRLRYLNEPLGMQVPTPCIAQVTLAAWNLIALRSSIRPLGCLSAQQHRGRRTVRIANSPSGSNNRYDDMLPYVSI
jgi:hypothetical protein